MKKLLICAILVLAALAIVGCFKHTFTVGDGAPNGQVVYDAWHAHWLFGIINSDITENINLKQVCPSGDATIHEEISFINGLIGALIGVIYYPTTVTIRCRGGRGEATLDLTVEQAAQIVADPGFLYLVEEVAPERMNDARLAQQNAINYLSGVRTAQLH